MRYLVITTSLNPDSQSRILAQESMRDLEEQGAEAQLIDLQDYELPFCDGGPAFEHEDVQALSATITEARGVILATPVYNYTISSSAKNLIELTGPAWNEKVVGFMCAAGGHSSYMAITSIANSLMLDFRCHVIPRFVYASEHAFHAGELSDELMRGRIRDLTILLTQVTDGLYPA